MNGPHAMSGDLAQTVLEELPYALVVFAPVRDEAGVLVDVAFEYHNSQAAQLLSYSSDRLAGVLLSDLRSPRANPGVIGLCDRVLATRETMIDVIPTRVGLIRLVACAIGDRVVVIARDIQGDATDEAIDQLRRALESTTDNLVILAPIRDERGDITDFRCTYVEDRWLRSIGINTDRLDLPLRAAMPGYPEGLIDGYRQVLETGAPFETEWSLHLGRRGTHTVHVVATRYQNGVIVASRDTTAETNARLELARSEERFRSTVEAMTESVVMLQAVRDEHREIVDFDVTFANAAAEHIVERPASEVVGRRLLELQPDLVPLGVMAQLVGVATTGVPITVETPWRWSSGMGVVESSFVRLGDGIVALGRDVTERIRNRRMLEDSERRFHMLAENAGDAVFYGTLDGILWVSPSVESLLGWKQEELIGTQALDLVHPDDRHLIIAARERYRPGSSTRTRVRLRRRDGATLWVETMARLIPALDGVDDGLLVSTVWSVQAEVEAQEALARAEAERRASEARLNQAARLESLGVMAGGIAHDFNNLLVGVLGNAEIALLELPADSPVRERLERITLAAQRAADLTRQLLDYTGNRSGPLDVVDMSALVAETRDLVAARLPRSTVITSTPQPAVPAVRGDRAQLQQVVLNLIINASDALAGRDGHVTVTVGSEQIPESSDHTTSMSSPLADLTAGRYVTVAVADDGPGMPAATLQRVFEPFFTTKPTGRGLGLAVVHGVVRAHHGTVVPESTEGAGTTMTVYLPATTDRPPTAVEEPAGAEDSRDAPLVLVVDDDDAVRDVSGLVLQRAGMRVHAERDGRSAIEELRRRPSEFSAVLLDLTMPDMSGDAVFAALREIRADLPVVLISGYSAADVHGRIADLSIDGFVKKPFRPGELVEALQRAIAPPAR